jgi:hypothetical protein
MDSLGKKTKQTQDEIDKSDKTVKNLGASFSDLTKSFVAGQAIIDFFKGIAKSGNDVTQLEISMGRLAKITGVNASQIDAWDAALQRFGGHAGDFTNWFSSTSHAFIAAGQGDQIKNIIPNLIELGDKWKDMNFQQKQFWETNLHLSDSMILALDKGGTSFANLAAQIEQVRGVTGKTSDEALHLDNTWKHIGDTWTRIYNDLLPLRNLLANLLSYMSETFGYVVEDIAHGRWEHLLLGNLGSQRPKNYLGDSQPINPLGGNPNLSEAAKILPLISHYESGDRNIPNASGPGGMPASSASGYYQILKGTWQQFAPQVGVSLSQYPTAMSAPLDLQTKVANLIYNKQGLAPWNSDSRLMAAAAAGRISTADATPVNTGSGGVSKNVHVNIEHITINTPDAHSVSSDLSNNLATQMRHAVGSMDDGIAR